MNAPLKHLLQILYLEDIRDRPYPDWAVQDVLPRKGLAMLYGPSGCGKSLLVVDFAAKAALALPWFERPVRERLRVTLFALEGKDGLRKRLEAWEKHNAKPFPGDVTYVLDSFSLGDDEQVDRAVRKIALEGGTDVVVIDTLNRASPLADENRSADMGKLIRGATRLQEGLDCLVVLVHHTGKDESRGPRGHSSLYAALDVVVEVNRKDEARYWRLVKSKDGVDGVSRSFDLVGVQVALDEYGTPITSAAVVELEDEAPAEERKVRLGKHQSAVLDELRAYLLAQEQEAQASPDTPIGLPYDEALQRALPVVDVAPSRKTERTKDALDSLLKSDHLRLVDGLVRLSE
ncbi:MAG: AAA family ATPase [Burkholderiales bacterium]